MVWNPSPEVAIARDFGIKFNKKMVIIFHVNDKGELGYASYGETKILCSEAQKLADRMFEFIIKDEG